MDIIDGKLIAAKILQDLAKEVAILPYKPLLCDIVVGEDPVALSYVRIKGRTAQQTGLEFKLLKLPDNITDNELIGVLRSVQTDPHLGGLIMQLPLPPGFDTQTILDSIDPEFDVDCLGSINSEAFYSGHAYFVPPTAGAILEIIDSLTGKLGSLADKQILVVGQGELVGKPTTQLLKEQGYQVITADSRTKDLTALTKQADIIISGTGQARLVKGDMVKPGSIIIDAGTSESGSGIVGDVDTESMEGISGLLSPVPGGVGPVTVAKLLSNVVLACQRRTKTG